MFGFFKQSPTKKRRKVYDQKLEEAMLAQRKGDMRSYAMLTAQAEEMWREIESLEKQQAD
ncbi:DUF6435 family protein [Paraglaciecola sp. L1A13]|uniref:DUF6435 family protein n=1 Tax=Paraglaciecola sp. L1A13 TaxID=2686359 RepID=UPI00131CB6D9|nr:DUF6435 family protein [Paraglaciecola sp. L1A13]|tara:strand:- start:8382 stop:8561 length:180 start_codon:yes stop_codon:yes gene_type:complete